MGVEGLSSAADPHRHQVNVLEVAADQKIHGVENDEAVELAHVLVRVTGLAVDCVRENGAFVAEVACADPRLEGELGCGEVLQVSYSYLK